MVAVFSQIFLLQGPAAMEAEKRGGLFERLLANRGPAWAVVAASLGFVAFVDYLSGNELAFSIFYLISVSLACWYLGLAAGVWTSLASALLWFLNDSIFQVHDYENWAVPYWNAGVRLGFFLIITLILHKLRLTLGLARRKNEELTAAYAQLDLARQEQLRVKDRVLSSVSHELRTPLTSTHQFISLVLDGVAGEVQPLQKEYLETAFRNLNQLNRLINDLLDATRIEAGKFLFKPVSVALRPLVEETFRTLYSNPYEKNVQLRMDLPDGLPALRVDPDRLRQVLINLLDNARRFSAPDGVVLVSARVQEKRPDMIEISVRDDGPGIDAASQKLLFLPLSQLVGNAESSRKGLGLGLFICKDIVSHHGGTIWVESSPGEGSRFCFTIPICEAAAADGGCLDEGSHEPKNPGS